jgi:hypothetical protein
MLKIIFAVSIPCFVITLVGQVWGFMSIEQTYLRVGYTIGIIMASWYWWKQMKSL